MTVLTQAKKVTVNGNGAATVHSFSPLVIYHPDDLQVVHVSSAGLETPVPRGTGSFAYSVTVSTYPGTGSIIFPQDEVTPLPSGESLVMKRLLTLKQDVNLENEGGYNPDTLEQFALDKLAMFDLQQQEELDRSLRLALSSSGVSTELPTPSAGLGLGWSPSEDAIVNLASLAGITIPVPLSQGGTGVAAGSASAALTALGVHSILHSALGQTTLALFLTAIGAEPADTDIVKTDVAATFTKGHKHTLNDHGNSGTATHTVDPDDGLQQKLTVTDDFTFAAPASGAGFFVEFLLEMDGTGGHTVTFSGFETTINGAIVSAASTKNLVRITRIDSNDAVEIVQL